MVPPLDQMLSAPAPAAQRGDNSGASDLLLRLPPHPAQAAPVTPTSTGGTILWTNAAPTRSVTTTSVRGITMRKSVIAIIVIVLVVLYMSIFVVKNWRERGLRCVLVKVLRDE